MHRLETSNSPVVMRRLILNSVFFLTLLMLLFNINAYASEDTLHYSNFGQIVVYYDSPRPANVVLFISGDGGWNLGVVDMARSLASLGSMVVGINITHYLNQLDNSSEKCSYPAGDFEMLSKYVQGKYEYPNYVMPMLVGYSSGATLAYAALVQAPTNTFKGAISLGFCPDLEINKPFCHGIGLEWTAGLKEKGYIFLPATTLEVPWIALQGDIDQVCDPAQTSNFVKQVKNGQIIELPKVGHGFSVERNWVPQFKDAFSIVAAIEPITPPSANAPSVKDLPLVEVAAAEPQKNIMAIHLTGDGGWGVTDKGMSKELAANGIPVVGWNSLKYFWHKRTPDAISKDLERVLTYYLGAWKKDKVILEGYSLGADVLPFMVSRLPDSLKAKIQLIAFIGLSHEVDFNVHLSNLFGGSAIDKDASQTLPEVEKLSGIKMLCFYGEDDSEVLCDEIPAGLVKSTSLQGGHLVKSHFGPITTAILDELNQK
jgi:type IV secretory pathway VirJ component